MARSVPYSTSRARSKRVRAPARRSEPDMGSVIAWLCYTLRARARVDGRGARDQNSQFQFGHQAELLESACFGLPRELNVMIIRLALTLLLAAVHLAAQV